MNMLDLMQALQTQIKVGDSLTDVKELRLLKIDLEQRIIKFKAEREMRELEQQEMHKSLQSHLNIVPTDRSNDSVDQTNGHVNSGFNTFQRSPIMTRSRTGTAIVPPLRM